MKGCGRIGMLGSMSEQGQHGRTPPRSEEAERAVLGALLLDPDRIPEVAEVVKAEDFWDKRHEHVFGCLLALSENSNPVDFVSAGEALKARGVFAEVGGAEYLVQLAHGVTTSAHAMYHAQRVADTATLRRVIRESTDIVREAFETPAEGVAVRELLDTCEQRMFQIARREDGHYQSPRRFSVD